MKISKYEQDKETLRLARAYVKGLGLDPKEVTWAKFHNVDDPNRTVWMSINLAYKGSIVNKALKQSGLIFKLKDSKDSDFIDPREKPEKGFVHRVSLLGRTSQHHCALSLSVVTTRRKYASYSR